ncbi:MAG TPA: alpha/beta hydrolase [Candidatus Binatia bacterium]|nr:alpha/beta hydrolase [Candidatus Binatia bacterium]
MAEEAHITVDGIKTFYVKAGRGPAVLLVHGGSPGACALINWKFNIDALAAAGFTVYAYDQPGFGRTDNPTDFSMEYRVGHAKAFARAVGLDRFHVIGNSQGSYIAARLALEEGGAMAFVTTPSGSLAPAGSAESQALAQRHNAELREYTPSIENMRKLTLGTLFNRELVTDKTVRERYEMSTGKNFEAQKMRETAPRPKPIRDALRRLKSALIIWGNNDRGVSIERGVLLFQLIPGAEFHLFDNCAHWAQWDQADRFNRIVADFLKREPAE